MRAWLSTLLAPVLLVFLALPALSGLPAPASAEQPRGDAATFQLGVEAYRAGDLQSAETHWRSLLRSDAEVDRADVLYNLGNLAWRRGDALEAAARYTACIRLAPRHADAWHNLEFVRSEAGLEPADRGDLTATAERLVDMLTRSEAGWTSLALLVLFACLLLFEALRGGPLTRRLAFAGGVLFVLGSLPVLRHALRPESAPWFVIEPAGAALRSEPQESGTVVGRLDSGTQAVRLDELPGWVRLRASDGTQGWAAAQELLRLDAVDERDPAGS